jgi:hypothetical protein
MTPGAAKAKRRAKAAEEATVEAIEEGTERIRRSVKRGSRAVLRRRAIPFSTRFGCFRHTFACSQAC